MMTTRARMQQCLRMMGLSPMGAMMAVHFTKTGERGHFRTTSGKRFAARIVHHADPTRCLVCSEVVRQLLSFGCGA
eukprot:1005268-Lingulodinium_polyedra.AAC.1